MVARLLPSPRLPENTRDAPDYREAVSFNPQLGYALASSAPNILCEAPLGEGGMAPPARSPTGCQSPAQGEALGNGSRGLAQP